MENNTFKKNSEKIDENYLRGIMNRDARYTKKVYDRSCPVYSPEPQFKPCPCPEPTPTPPANCSYPSLAMVYAPRQSFKELYDIGTALKRGTLFRELDLPFLAYKGGK